MGDFRRRVPRVIMRSPNALPTLSDWLQAEREEIAYHSLRVRIRRIARRLRATLPR